MSTNRLTLHAAGYEAWIDMEGASCIRLARPSLGLESLRTPEGAVENPFLYGMPPLFPPNRIRDGRFSFAGQPYQLPVNEPERGCFLHGTLHGEPFMLAEYSAGRAVLTYREGAGKYLGFPHAFHMEIAYTLDEHGLSQMVRVTNNSPRPMPFGLAFHTTFRLPFASGSRAEDVRLQIDLGEEILRDDARLLPTWETATDTPLHRQAANGTLVPVHCTISRHFAQGNAHRMTLTDTRTGARIVYETPDYGYWMLYNGGAQDLLCVEPQTWVIDAPNAPWPPARSGLRSIAPGETETLRTCLRLEG